MLPMLSISYNWIRGPGTQVRTHRIWRGRQYQAFPCDLVRQVLVMSIMFVLLLGWMEVCQGRHAAQP